MSAAPAKLNPFPGLRPFTQEEDYLFFGREEQTIELLQRLGSNRVVAVVVASASGRSSISSRRFSASTRPARRSRKLPTNSSASYWRRRRKRTCRSTSC